MVLLLYGMLRSGTVRLRIIDGAMVRLRIIDGAKDMSQVAVKTA